MADRPILPTIGSVVGAAKDALIAARPSAAPHVEQGEWSHVFSGWRAQFAVERAYLADEVRACRLPGNTGQSLTELARSEFDCPRNDEPSKALGEVVLTRVVVHASAGQSISAADATDGASAVAALEAIRDWANTHIRDLYVAATGLGAHNGSEVGPGTANTTGDVSSVFAVSSSDMGQLVGTTNDFKEKLNRHLGNQFVGSGDALVIHRDADTLNIITTADAFASAGGSAFSANSVPAQRSLLLLVNALLAKARAHAALESKPGTIRKGTIFKLAASPTSVPPIAGGNYSVLVDFYLKRGDQVATPIIESSIDGPSANVPLFETGGPTLRVSCSSPLFDSGAALPLTITTIRAAGGSSGQTDEELRRAATASWCGVFGPTAGALVAGAYRAPGVHQIFPIEDNVRGGTWMYTADGTWAWSYAWSARVERSLRDDWLGFGCKLRSGRVVNRIVRVEAAISLRDAGYLVDPTEITLALQKAAQEYFDVRPDWPVFRLSTLRGVLARAHPRILTCTSAVVLDADGRPIAEPANPEPGAVLTHWRFEDKALDVTYAGPS